jgi:hypothetical protein
MNAVDQAYETQLKNIQTRSGKTLNQLNAIIRKSGLTKHGEIRDMLKRDVGLGHGDANTLAHFYLKSDGTRAAEAKGATTDNVLDEIYSGPKAELRPIHDKVLAAINKFGEFEIAPKKGYVSLRRKKQFAMVGPASKMRVEVGLNMKDVTGPERLVAQAPGGMCQYKVYLTAAKDVDKELIAWIKRAYDSAG